MAERVKPVSSRNGAGGFRPGAMAVAVALTLGLILLFHLLTQGSI